MSTPGAILKVDPSVLRHMGRCFEQVGDDLGALNLGAPLSDAATGVAHLATGAALAQAQEDVATQMTSLADGTRTYGRNVGNAAEQYHSGDQSSAHAVGAVQFSK